MTVSEPSNTDWENLRPDGTPYRDKVPKLVNGTVATPKEIAEKMGAPSRGEPQVSHILGKYLNTMVSDLRIDGKGEYLRELFSRYESEAERGHVVLLEALKHALPILIGAIAFVDCKAVVAEVRAAIEQAERT